MTIAHPPVLSTKEAHRLEREGGVEFVDGRIQEKPVSMESSDVAATVLTLLNIDARKSRAARVYDSSLGYKVFPEDPEKFRKPDVSLIRTERLAGMNRKAGFAYAPPDLAVEVISPGDLAFAVFEKVDDYLRHNFPLVWVVQLNTRSVAIYRADGSTALLHENDEITGETALPGFRCRVAEFFE